MATVHLFATLRPLAGGNSTVHAEGSTLREVVEDLERQFPALRGRIIDDGGQRPEIFLAIGSTEAFGLSDAVTEDSEIHILAAIAGGS